VSAGWTIPFSRGLLGGDALLLSTGAAGNQTRTNPNRGQVTGSTYAPDGVITENGGVVEHPADRPALLHVAMCASLCNDSAVHFNQDKGVYEKIGESSEVALRVLAEKMGLPGFDSMPTALNRLSKQDRVSYCNAYWEGQFSRIATLEFARDRKMMSVLCTRKGQVLAPHSTRPPRVHRLAASMGDTREVAGRQCWTLTHLPPRNASMWRKQSRHHACQPIRRICLQRRQSVPL
jgi:magnesium-transporting ATPase (P-type)